MHAQRVLTRLGLSAETDGTPKVVRSRLLNAAGLQPLRTFLAHFLHRRRTRNGAPSALAATLAEEGIVVIPEFLPAPVFEAVQAEFRRALDHALHLAAREDGDQSRIRSVRGLLEAYGSIRRGSHRPRLRHDHAGRFRLPPDPGASPQERASARPDSRNLGSSETSQRPRRIWIGCTSAIAARLTIRKRNSTKISFVTIGARGSQSTRGLRRTQPSDMRPAPITCRSRDWGSSTGTRSPILVMAVHGAWALVRSGGSGLNRDPYVVRRIRSCSPTPAATTLAGSFNKGTSERPFK